MPRRKYRTMGKGLLNQTKPKIGKRGRRIHNKAKFNQNVRVCNKCGKLKENTYENYGFQKKPNGHYKQNINCRECTKAEYRKRYAATRPQCTLYNQ